jgi:hypothetical protein
MVRELNWVATGAVLPWTFDRSGLLAAEPAARRAHDCTMGKPRAEVPQSGDNTHIVVRRGWREPRRWRGSQHSTTFASGSTAENLRLLFPTTNNDQMRRDGFIASTNRLRANPLDFPRTNHRNLWRAPIVSDAADARPLPSWPASPGPKSRQFYFDIQVDFCYIYIR